MGQLQEFTKFRKLNEGPPDKGHISIKCEALETQGNKPDCNLEFPASFCFGSFWFIREEIYGNDDRTENQRT